MNLIIGFLPFILFAVLSRLSADLALWVAFAAFLVAALLGTWQMWVRSPLGANVGTPGQYFMSVTAHGVSMAYVVTTFFIMGFGYFVAVTALDRALPGKVWAWIGFWMGLVGVVMAVIPILMDQEAVIEPICVFKNLAIHRGFV